METNVLTKSQVLRVNQSFHWAMTFFVGGFVAFVLGLLLGSYLSAIYVLAALGFMAMVISLTAMTRDVTNQLSKRVTYWRNRTLSD